MKRKSRIATLLLVCVLLGGCGAKEATKEQVSLTWYLRTDIVDFYNQLIGFKQIEENVGIDVVFQAPPDGNEDAYRMMVASGNLPDIIMWNYSSGIDRMAEEGTAIELSELIAQYAPNLTRIFEERPELRKEVENADGKIYFFPSINPMLSQDEICRKNYIGLIVRQDWLDKLGLTMPRTIDDWHDMLIAFKTRDPNGNDLQDEIPFDGWGLHYFAPAFGVLKDFCVKPDGTVAYGPMEQEYKAYLETINQWYSERLLGSNCIIQSEQWKDNNITNDLTGAFLGLDNAWRYYLPSLQEKAPDAQLLAVPWVESASGIRYTPQQSTGGHIAATVTIITSKCENPIEAVRLIDYLYSQEGGALLHWGVEGVTYEVVDGEKKLLPFALETAASGYLNLYHYAIAHTSWPKYDGETAVLATYPEDQLIAEMTWADASMALIYPTSIRMSTEEKNYCVNVMDSITNYVNEMEIKFITGEELLSNFDQFVSNLKRMGIEEVLEIYRHHYAEFMQ